MIGIGVSTVADRSLKENLIYSVKRPDSVAINSDSDDSDIEIVEPNDVQEVQREQEIEIIELSDVDEDIPQELPKEQGLIAINNVKNINRKEHDDTVEQVPQVLDDQQSLAAEIHSENIKNAEKDSEELVESVEEISKELDTIDSETAEEKISEPIPEPKPVTQLSSLSVEDLQRKHQELRHWKASKAILIEAQPMKCGRKRRASTFALDKTDKTQNENLTKPKRGRPKQHKEVKEKLIELAKSQPAKEVAPKRKQGVKVKLTKENRGAFLTEPIPIQKKRGRPRKNSI